MEKRNYDPKKDGAVVAIRIFEDTNNPWSPKAEIAFAFGGTAMIEWTCPDEREPFLAGINGYTFIFDERKKHEFKDFVKPRYEEWLRMQEEDTVGIPIVDVSGSMSTCSLQ